VSFERDLGALAFHDACIQYAILFFIILFALSGYIEKKQPFLNPLVEDRLSNTYLSAILINSFDINN